MPYFVYVLRSVSNGRFYVGQTQDLVERLRRHSEGRSYYTRSRGPWVIVHTETFATRAEAMKREKELKNRRSRSYLLDVISTTDHSVG